MFGTEDAYLLLYGTGLRLEISIVSNVKLKTDILETGNRHVETYLNASTRCLFSRADLQITN
jgi:hypothetical protein